ncbi:hypothetical protein BY458DRAFT_516557 [Sporodiniella umbellata]|nr:hypothetical protein BY458DRAFT_516557 [Sporodiniella umbellata]
MDMVAMALLVWILMFFCVGLRHRFFTHVLHVFPYCLNCRFARCLLPVFYKSLFYFCWSCATYVDDIELSNKHCYIHKVRY